MKIAQIAIVLACIIGLIPGVAYARGGLNAGLKGGQSCLSTTLNCREGSDPKGRDVTSTKDVDNESGEEQTERRGEEVENEAKEEQKETKAQEQSEQVTTTTHEGGSSNSGATGSHEIKN